MKKPIIILFLVILTLLSGCAPLVLSAAGLADNPDDEPQHIRYAKPIPEPVYEACEPTDQAFIDEILSLTNKEREEHGLSELSLSPTLNKIAEIRAADMVDNGYFDHVSPTGDSAFSMLQEYGVFHFTAAENIGRGNVSGESMVQAWMDSPEHKKNILTKLYHQMGVGIVEAGNGDLYWVQVFIN